MAVTAASVSDESPSGGGKSTLSVTVRNVGARAAAATTLRYYRSDDPTITTSDTEVVTDAVAGLAASKSTSQSLEVTAPVAPGTYYFGACVDAVTDETDTTNNCSAAVAITVQDTAAAQQGRPDLMVASPTVSHGSPSASARFTLSATVRNGGGGASAATTLRYYRSADASISTSDTEVATGDVAELSAAGSTSASVALTAPTTPGTYYYGACVDSVSDETDTTNNCSTSVRITLLEPDLVVGSPSVSDGGPTVGAQFTLSATVRNDGAGSGAATTLRYYRSSDATISTSDTEVGRGPVAGLAGSGSSSQSVDLVAPATPGIYYYGACVDAVTDESDTTNNCSTSVQVTVQQTVTEPQGDPDLTVTSVAVSDSDPTVGAKFTLSATVKNGGAGRAETTTLRYYRSADATITSADTEVGTDTITGLAASGSAGQSVELTAPATPGTYYYGACVDAVTDESDTTNNCSTSVQVTVPQPARPDLMVTSPSVSDSGPATGARFTLSASVRNGGNGDAPATTLRYYRSADAAITTSDTQVGTSAVAELAASGSASQLVDLTAPATPGTYYYGACVDAVTDESDTTNNCSGSVKVAILQPDLVVGAPSVSKSDPEAGEQFTLRVTVENNGEGGADATTLRYYYSTDTAITTSDTALDTDAIGGLAASGTSSQSVDLAAPSTPGTYYYGACVDAVTDESDTTNNCSTSVQVTVPQPKPDLVVGTPSVDDRGPAAGAAFTLSATVENEGGGAAAATTLRYHQSADATISTSDREVGADAIGGLAASGTSSQSVDLTAPSTPGTYYYGACVDALTDESDTTNNCSASVQVTVPVAEQQVPPTLVTNDPPRYNSQDYEFQVVQVATGLRYPWSLAFLPDGDLLVTERAGYLKRIDAQGSIQVINGLPTISAFNQGGLLDVVLDTSFAQNQRIYFSYSQLDGGYRTAVARAQLSDNQLNGVQIIFTMNKPSTGSTHFGSRLAMLSDGDLVVTLGDRGERNRAQDPSDHAGSVLRIQSDGSPSSRNKEFDIPNAAAEVFTFGHRNPQGLAVHPTTGAIWIHEHGPQGGDEVNILIGGANYGWPVVTFGTEYSGEKISEGTEKEGMESPLLQWTPSIAPSGMAFYTGDDFPLWNGNLFVGALAGRHLRRIAFQNGAGAQQEVLLQDVLGRIRDVRQGPNGRLWLLTDASNGGIYRIEPVPPK